MPISLVDNGVVVSFPEVHPDAALTVAFQSTLRVPDDGATYRLPSGLGRLPLRRVVDLPERRLPQRWLASGGVVMPMWQSQACWLSFQAHYPYAWNLMSEYGRTNVSFGFGGCGLAVGDCAAWSMLRMHPARPTTNGAMSTERRPTSMTTSMCGDEAHVVTATRHSAVWLADKSAVVSELGCMSQVRKRLGAISAQMPKVDPPHVDFVSSAAGRRALLRAVATSPADHGRRRRPLPSR